MDELAADEAPVDDCDDDMTLHGTHVAIDHHHVVVVDACLDHAAAAYPEYKARRPIEP